LGSLLRCFYVNLPLFHRRWAGIAKVKIKEKAGESHVFCRFWSRSKPIVQ
jgi:hypothetical protein